jgi:excinuclease ABC subunit C
MCILARMTREHLAKARLPDTPGVYLFRGKGRKILYIGKAASLRDRVRSYFSKDLSEARSPAVAGMVAQAESVSYRKTDSVLEALILEANLIKQYQPPYNIEQKDNKSFNYLVITKEDFPRVLIVRGRQLFQDWKDVDIKYLFGPFPEGGSLKEALRIVRKIFPFRDTCIPCADAHPLPANSHECAHKEMKEMNEGKERRTHCRPCFNRQIGLCPGVCSGEISKEEYAHAIRNIRDLFSGNFHGLKRRLAREMKAAAGAERFEEAGILRRQVDALEHIRDVSLIKDESRISSGGGVRIEAYDVAHTSGTEAVGVMTVVSNGQAVKAAYRKFKIRSATNDDVAALSEMLERRLNHSEWPLPRVFAVDGGKGQMRAAQRILKSAGVEIPIVGVVKNEFHKPERLIGDAGAIRAYERDILLANNEAHRFAISWHRQRRGKRALHS